MIQFTRKFAMPSKDTFTMIPVAELLAQRIQSGEVWADPFAGWNSPATHTNDLNPDAPTDYHMNAVTFCDNELPEEIDGVLFDPPYSANQIVQSYKRVGQVEWRDGQVQKFVKDICALKVKPGGLAICFGWNSNGFSVKRGFRMEQILLLQHGGGHNDTIITVERKIQANLL